MDWGPKEFVYGFPCIWAYLTPTPLDTWLNLLSCCSNQLRWTLKMIIPKPIVITKQFKCSWLVISHPFTRSFTLTHVNTIDNNTIDKFQLPSPNINLLLQPPLHHIAIKHLSHTWFLIIANRRETNLGPFYTSHVVCSLESSPYPIVAWSMDPF